jgi:phosphonate transport system substrate-binding protein
MNPHDDTQASKAGSCQAFANEAGGTRQGLLVAGNDSPISDIKDLDGLMLACLASVSFAATMLPMAALRASPIAVTSRDVCSHDLAVTTGLFPAEGDIQSTHVEMPPEVTDKLRVLCTTASYVPHAIAAPLGLDRRVIAAISPGGYDKALNPKRKAPLATMDSDVFCNANERVWSDVSSLWIN